MLIRTLITVSAALILAGVGADYGDAGVGLGVVPQVLPESPDAPVEAIAACLTLRPCHSGHCYVIAAWDSEFVVVADVLSTSAPRSLFGERSQKMLVPLRIIKCMS